MNLIDKLKELEANASAAPWDVSHRSVTYYKSCGIDDAEDMGISADIGKVLADDGTNLGASIIGTPEPDRGDFTVIDAHLIAELRNALPKLLALVEPMEMLVHGVQQHMLGQGSDNLLYSYLPNAEKALAALDQES